MEKGDMCCRAWCSSMSRQLEGLGVAGADSTRLLKLSFGAVAAEHVNFCRSSILGGDRLP